MKITKTKLRQLIRESLSEEWDWGSEEAKKATADSMDWAAHVDRAVDHLREFIKETNDTKAAIKAMKEAFKAVLGKPYISEALKTPKTIPRRKSV